MMYSERKKKIIKNNNKEKTNMGLFFSFLAGVIVEGGESVTVIKTFTNI